MKKARANSASIAGRPPLSSVGNKTIEKPQRKVSVPEKTATNRQKQTSEKDNALSKTYMSKSHDNLASVLRRKANNAGGNIGAHRPKSVIGLQKSEENLKTMDATTHTQSVKAKTRVTPVIVTSSPSRNDKSSASGSKPLQKASSTQNINKTPTSVKRASSTQNVNRDKAGAQNVNRGDKVIRQRISAPSNILAYNAELLANFEKEKKILEGRISDLQQVSENRKTEIERHKFEIKRLKEKVKARSKEEVDKLQHENKLLKDRLLELGIPLSEQITDSEKLSLLLQHAGSTCSGGRDSDVSPGKNNQGHYDGETDSEVSVDLTCVTPEHPSSLSFDNNSCWERQSNKSLDALSEVSVACLQDRISQMEETHYSTSEELQATLQELGDLQSAVNELTSENEHLASERGVLLESLCAQTEKLENARIQIDHLKLLLIGDTTNNVNKCDRERQLIELVKSAHVERDEIVLRQQELNNSLQSLEKENSETFDIIVALKDKIRLLEDKNESILVDKKVAEDSCRETRELLDAEKIELQRYKSLLENEKGKVEKLEQFQKTQDQSEVAKLLEKTRQEKDRLEVVIADVRESLALSQCETTRFKENLNTLEQEMKVIKNNARTSVSDMEFKLEKMSTEKMSVLTETETLREQIEQLEQELDECLEEKKTYQDSQKDTQAQLDIMQQRCAEVEREMADLKAQHETESSEWIQFQSDLQKAVVIANDIKMETQEDMEETLNENLLLKEKVASYQQELQKVSNELEKLKASDDVKENQAESPSISVSSREIRGRVLTSVDRELTNLRQTRNTTGNNQQSISVKNLIKSIEQQVKNSHVCTSPPAADTSRRSSAETPITKTLDPRNLEIRTKSVEKTLEPLVTQVTTLVNQKGPYKKKKGRSKKAHVLSAAVQKATENFIIAGEEIALENPDIRDHMLAAVDDVRKTGEQMRVASEEFAADPCSSMKRGAMVRAARALLSSVTRLLILADMVDVHVLLENLKHVEDDLDHIKNARNQQELMQFFRQFGQNVMELSDAAGRRQNDLKDPRRRDDLAAARATLKKNSMMLLTTSKAYIRHPELAAARSNRDYAYKQVCDAVNTIHGVAEATGQSEAHPYEGIGELAAALDEFDEKIIMDPATYNEVRSRPSLEERLESIISGAALMADSTSTRDERRERIVQECNAVRQALQDLLTEYMNNCRQTKRPIRKAGNPKPSESLDQAIENMCQKTRGLRKQLKKAVVDHVSDSFLETNVPLLVLVEAASKGQQDTVEEYAQVFAEHANKLVEIANLACSMSNDEEGVKCVRLAASQIEDLCPQVINAARVLAARPNSKVAQENMDVFKNAWEKQVRLLTEAVDDITTIDDFLAVSEGHILEDVHKCVYALHEKDMDTLDRTAGAIRGRSARVVNVVAAEMDNYEPGPYTERVMDEVVKLRDQYIPTFAEQVEVAVDGLTSNRNVDENEFIGAARMMYDGVRDIRRAVLLNRDPEELDSEDDVVYEDEQSYYDYDMRSRSSAQMGEYDDKDTDRYMMRQLPEEEKTKIQQQFEVFRVEKRKLDQEIGKWDERGNDIIILAKQMCMIMMEMTDFTRGRGPLKNTMDVINAAKKISEAGSKLDKLARAIAEPCPDSEPKKDLIAYLQRIALYCHQLNITSKVKADVQNISGELIVSGLDSATSLIQSAKNLMNAVVLVVKASYVASTKYRSANHKSPVVLWRMKAPEKKPLVRRENPEEIRAKIRRSTRLKKIEPVKALSEFQELLPANPGATFC
ncbi:catenin alpha-2-like [Tubulanus polymorphus]|uniref:catenin alpha-2-like n=1 Tax=Tubulanus polymorphus TaxID=672921 RepID=UPI003DA2C4AF